MTPQFNLPLQAVRAASKQTTMFIDSTGKAVGGIYCADHVALACAAVGAINTKSDLASLLIRVRLEYGRDLQLSGETLIEIDNALAGKAVPA